MISIELFLGFIMDRNPNYFPILLTVGVLVCILLYALLNLIVFFHQRKLKNKDKSISIVDDELTEQTRKMTGYLQGVDEIQ